MESSKMVWDYAENISNALFSFMLKGYKIKPNAYRLRNIMHVDNGLRSWHFEGSNDGRTWAILSTHKEDYGAYKSKTWKLENVNDFYAYFRLVLKDENGVGRWELPCSGMEIYGDLMSVPSVCLYSNGSIMNNGQIATIGTIDFECNDLKNFGQIKAKNVKINCITFKDESVETDIVNIPQFKLGDRIKLHDGKTGVISFVGNEFIGIELDSWSANAGNGSFRSKKVFETSHGRGYFARRQSVANIGESKIIEGAYARLKGLVRVPKFNGKTVKIVAYVEKKERWKVQLLNAKQQKKYLGVREDCLDPILDWEPIAASPEDKMEALKVPPSLDDRVKTRQGRIGKVKYVGSVQFAPNSKSIHIGLELEYWDPNAHDGTVKEIRYFECAKGRGYFVKLEDLTRNFGPHKPKEDGIFANYGNVQCDNKGRLLIKCKKFSNFGEMNMSKINAKIDCVISENDASINPRPNISNASNAFIFDVSKQCISISDDCEDWIERILLSSSYKILYFDQNDENEILAETYQCYENEQNISIPIKNDNLKYRKVKLMFDDDEKEKEKRHVLQIFNFIWDNDNKRLIEDKEQKENDDELSQKNKFENAKVGDRVELARGKMGIIRYIGAVKSGSSEKVIGIELDQFGAESHDARAYFETETAHRHTVFKTWDDVKQLIADENGILQEQQHNILKMMKAKDVIEAQRQNIKVFNLEVGDNVKLMNNSIGTVKYIGFVHFDDENGNDHEDDHKEEMVGIELDQWSPNGHNGEVNGNTYFESSPGRGIFARRNSIAERLNVAEINDIESMLYPDSGDRIKLVDGSIGVVRWVDTANKSIQIQLDSSELQQITLEDVKENLGKQQIMDMDAGKVNDSEIVNGAHVRLNGGKTGFIRFIGKIGNVEEMIGIEFDSWSHNGHDGKGHFKCTFGRGYFTERHNVIQIIKDEQIDTSTK